MSKICEKCGRILEDNEKFCPYCGTVAEREEKAPTKEKDWGKRKDFIKNDVNKAMTALKGRPLNKKSIFGICAAAAAILLIILIAGRPKTIDLKDYTEVKFDGYDKKGYCWVDVDEDKIFNDLYDIVLKRSLKKNEEGLFQQELLLDEILNTCIHAEARPHGELSNGDKVKVSVTADNKMFKKYKVKFKNYEETFKVENLPKPETLDLFSDFKPKITGISPYLILDKYPSASKSGCTILLDATKHSSIANGDEIIFTVQEDAPKGYVYKEEQFTYKVEGFDAYVTDAKDLTRKEIDEIKTELMDSLTSGRAFNSGWFDEKNKLYIEPLKVTASPAYIDLKYAVKENFILGEEATLYINNGESNTRCNVLAIPLECDVKDNNGVVYHAYGVAGFENLMHDAKGDFKFSALDFFNKRVHVPKKFCSFFVDKDDADNEMQRREINDPDAQKFVIAL